MTDAEYKTALAKIVAKYNLDDHGLEGKERSSAAAGVSGEAARGRAPLETYANKVNSGSLPAGLKGVGEAERDTLRSLEKSRAKLVEAKWEGRLERAKFRTHTRKLSTLPRVRKCGHTVRRKAGVGMVADLSKDVGRIAGFRGLYSCASVWVCPRCSQLITIARRDEVQTAIEKWTRVGANLPDYKREIVVSDCGQFFYSTRDGSERSFEELGHEFLDPKTGELYTMKAKTRLAPIEKQFEAGRVVMGTFTIRHQAARKQTQAKWGLAPLWDALGVSFKRMTNDRFFKGNIPGFIRSVEITYSSDKGWHPHLHVLFFVTEEFAAEMEAAAAVEPDKDGKRADAESVTSLKQLWIEAVKKSGYTAELGGQDFKLFSDVDHSTAAESMSGYVTKAGEGWGAAMEMTGWSLKRGTDKGAKKAKSATPIEMANALYALDAVGAAATAKSVRDWEKALGKEGAHALFRWREFEEASHGRRQMTWSRGMKEAFGIGLDEESIVDVDDTDQDAEDKASADQGTVEVGGFPHSSSWTAFANVVKNPVDLRRILEEKTAAEMPKILGEWADYYQHDVLLGAAWQAHLAKFEAADALKKKYRDAEIEWRERERDTRGAV